MEENERAEAEYEKLLNEVEAGASKSQVDASQLDKLRNEVLMPLAGWLVSVGGEKWGESQGSLVGIERWCDSTETHLSRRGTVCTEGDIGMMRSDVLHRLHALRRSRSHIHIAVTHQIQNRDHLSSSIRI